MGEQAERWPRWAFRTRELLEQFSASQDMPQSFGWLDGSKPLIAFFVGVTWHDTGGGQRPVQLAKALMQLGCQVLFLTMRKADNVGVRDLACVGNLPFPDARLSEQQDMGLIDELLRRASVAEQRAAVFEFPCRRFDKLMRIAKSLGYVTAYDIIDLWRDFPDVDWYDRDAETALTAGADHIFYSARALAVQRGVYLPNAGEVEMFRRPSSQEPDDLVRGEVTLGYWGSLDPNLGAKWFDWDLVAYVAKQRPSWRIVLLGPTRADFRKPPGLENVDVLGVRPIERLADYLPWFDVCLIPFKNTRMTRAVNPVKVYEYLAGYKPVVASMLPEIEGFPHVRVTRNAADFLAAIEQARSAAIDRRAVDDFLASNTWTARAQRFLEVLGVRAHAGNADV
jgi:glycosyltransferase involved in cell wall biosynthesis